MKNTVVNINGQISTGEAALVSVFDRSYLYGDSLYEVVRTYHGKYFGLDEHLERMNSSARLCHMELDQSNEHYKQEMYRTYQEFQNLTGQKKTEVYCRIIVSRGVGKIGFGQLNLLTPTQYTIIVMPLDAPTPQQFEKGLYLKVAQRLRNDRRALDPAMKSGNYLNSLLAYLESVEEHRSGNEEWPQYSKVPGTADDALMCNFDAHITEGTTFNIFYVKNGIVVTPPLDIGILDGITRAEIIKICQKLEIECREVRFPKERLYEADEVFISSSIKEVFPVSRVDDHTIHGGRPGPVTKKLAEAFKKWITDHNE